MNTIRFGKLLWLVPIALMVIAGQPAAKLQAQAGKSAAAASQYNIVKEIMDHKATLDWKPAGNGIPADVCTILLVCNGTTKVIALPRSTEGGQPVGRGVYLTQDDKKADVLVLERQTPVDTYFFLLTPQGTLGKAAYAQVGSRSWTPVGMALSGSVFDKDRVVWHNWASKLGTAAADKKPES
ncbi:MAG: hypothetical protein DMG31_19250 [Acidobacteria bacterium]|nr:MAG: hypothetical protein DMG31_19250 [Acidobacteriota bacterium]